MNNGKGKKKYDSVARTIIIGGGASGLMFAAFSKAGGGDPQQDGLILEKTQRVGTKLLMTGGGRCNITHAGSIKSFEGCYRSASEKKPWSRIRTMMYRNSNEKLMRMFSSIGVDTEDQGDARIFPTTYSAAAVRDALVDAAYGNGWQLKLQAEVIAIKALACAEAADIAEARELAEARDHYEARFIVSTADGRSFAAENVVIATGGCSFPRSGSDGSMFSTLSRDIGVGISELSPALLPISVTDYPFRELSGVTLPHAEVNGTGGGLLFTHSSFSGPAALNAEAASAAGKIRINYVGANYEAVLLRLKEATLRSRKNLANIISEEFGLPKRFCSIMCGRSGESLKKLARLLTEDEFTVSSRDGARKDGDARERGFYAAMVTHGGIRLEEIDCKTMQLVGRPGLYAIGEAVDIDGISGGYNLQFCFASALTAAESIENDHSGRKGERL